jgi:hypothetical protein
MKSVLAFLRLSTNTSIWSRSCCTPIWFSSPLAAPSSSWVSVYVPSGRSTRLHAHALDYGACGRITTKPTLVGHIHPNNIIFSQKLLVCVMINKTLFWWWLCAHLSNVSYCWRKKVHSAPITQQAGKLASHAQRANDVPVNFSWKLTKDGAVRYQSLELAG